MTVRGPKVGGISLTQYSPKATAILDKLTSAKVLGTLVVGERSLFPGKTNVTSQVLSGAPVRLIQVVPKVVEPDSTDTGSLERPAPAVANRVLVWRIFPVAAEDPRRGLGLNAIAGDVAGKQLVQLRCEEYGSLAAALRRPQLDAALVGSGPIEPRPASCGGSRCLG
jgi:hypothetical protein